ncbi:hypothetical protein [Viridibacillus arvi]|uniref:hypothetical protein n=1 Tax=Viridibacillus arvi TaxID=263475 RepID=UPI0034CE0BBA
MEQSNNEREQIFGDFYRSTFRPVLEGNVITAMRLQQHVQPLLELKISIKLTIFKMVDYSYRY